VISRLAIAAAAVLWSVAAGAEAPAPKAADAAAAQPTAAPSEGATAVPVTGPHGTFDLPALEHEFGEVTAGTPLSHSFEFRNRGKADLEITDVKPSCGCTKGEFDKLVKPGKAGKITLSIAKTEGYNGAIVKTATVTTNDPEHPTVKLTLRAHFKPDPKAVPQTAAAPQH